MSKTGYLVTYSSGLAVGQEFYETRTLMFKTVRKTLGKNVFFGEKITIKCIKGEEYDKWKAKAEKAKTKKN